MPSDLFLVTIGIVFATQVFCVVVGARVASLMPWHLKSTAKFYLSPIIGFACLVVFSCWYGQNLPLGKGMSTVLVCLIVFALCLYLETNKFQLLKFAFIISSFSCLCGASLLSGLYAFEAFNFHNDGFTYLAHGDWLQNNAFNDRITAVDVTPAKTQIALYQSEGFRMGGSYLLGLIQSVSQLKWSIDVYPSVVILATANCCMAIGFPLSNALKNTSRLRKFELLSLPALSVGGMVFSMSFGFLPQSLGVSLGAAFIFLYGALTLHIQNNYATTTQLTKWAVLPCLLFSASVYAYSEFTLFLIASAGIYTFYLLFKSSNRKFLIRYVLIIIALSALILNLEILRAYDAIATQSFVVVGSPVNWPILAYLFHAIGIHGGAWDGLQTMLPGTSLFTQIVLTPVYVLSILLLLTGLVYFPQNKYYKLTLTTLIIAVHSVLFLYFRYVVESPFPIGKGQSWSQFKISDWLHPFMSVIIISGLLFCLAKQPKIMRSVVHGLFVFFMLLTVAGGYERARHMMKSFPNVTHLSSYLKKLPSVVSEICDDNASIYLDMGGSYHKVRQSVSLFLDDRDLKSNWFDDGYIFHQLVDDNRHRTIKKGDCVIQPEKKRGYLSKGQTYGSFLIGDFTGQKTVFISSYTGSHDMETESENWWVWVPQQVRFELEAENVTGNDSSTVLKFMYGAIMQQKLTVEVTFSNGDVQVIEKLAAHNSNNEFSEFLDGNISSVRSVSIKTDAKPVRLNENDPRKAAFIIKNLLFETH